MILKGGENLVVVVKKPRVLALACVSLGMLLPETNLQTATVLSEPPGKNLLLRASVRA